MSAKPSWQDTLPPPGTTEPYTGRRKGTVSPRTLMLLGVAGFLLEVAFAGLIAFGPVEMEESMRLPVAGLIVLSGAAGLFFLYRMAKRQGL